MDIVQTFGIKPVLLVAQVVNFLILLYLLKRFLYQPVLKVLDERKRKIAQSLKDAAEIEKKLEQIAQEREKKLTQAASEAKEIIDDASQGADKMIKDARDKAALDIEKLVERAHKSMELEREDLHRQIKAELADLVVVALERVIGKNLSDKDKGELVKKSIKELI